MSSTLCQCIISTMLYFLQRAIAFKQFCWSMSSLVWAWVWSKHILIVCLPDSRPTLSLNTRQCCSIFSCYFMILSFTGICTCLQSFEGWEISTVIFEGISPSLIAAMIGSSGHFIMGPIVDTSWPMINHPVSTVNDCNQNSQIFFIIINKIQPNIVCLTILW